MICLKTLGYSILAGSVICSAVAWRTYYKGYNDGQAAETAKHQEVSFNQLTQYSKNKEVVYIPLIESHTELVTQIKEVKIYVKEKTNWNDTVCVPTARLHGYADSLYPNNADSTRAIIESMSSTDNTANTRK